MTTTKRVYRAGVYFDCPECGNLWRDDQEHAPRIEAGCPTCAGDLQLVGDGSHMVEYAKWFRCKQCSGLFMKRRGEVVPTKPRTGFAEHS